MRSLLLVVLLWLAPEDRGSIDIPQGIILSAVGAAQRASATGMEEFYCWIGEKRGRDVQVIGGYKPTQISWIDRRPSGIPGFDSITYFNSHGGCPEITVADIHTHPIDEPHAGAPSDIDMGTWSKTPYSYHAIIHPRFMNGTLYWNIVVYEHLGRGRFEKVVRERVRITPNPQGDH